MPGALRPALGQTAGGSKVCSFADGTTLIISTDQNCPAGSSLITPGSGVGTTSTVNQASFFAGGGGGGGGAVFAPNSNNVATTGNTTNTGNPAPAGGSPSAFNFIGQNTFENANSDPSSSPPVPPVPPPPGSLNGVGAQAIAGGDAGQPLHVTANISIMPSTARIPAERALAAFADRPRIVVDGTSQPVAAGPTIFRAAAVDIPPGSVCGGSGPVMLQLNVVYTSTSATATFSGNCGSVLGSGPPITTTQTPMQVCLTVSQDIISSLGGTTPTLTDSKGIALAGNSFDGVQACGRSTTVGTFSVGAPKSS